MDKTRVVCFAKALFPPKFNFKVVNSMNNGGQPDLDFHVLSIYQINLLLFENTKSS